MQEKIKQYIKDIHAFSAQTSEQLEQFRIKFLGKKGIIAELFSDFKNIQGEERKHIGQLLNELKNKVSEKVNTSRQEYQYSISQNKETIDLSLPADFEETGSRHPIAIVRDEIIRIFTHLGYTISEGPEIEDDRHNFTALNFPAEHPARDMQDTFFIEKHPDVALRTHTSSVQVRVMENNKPPIRTISPGRVFRNEAVSSRSHCIFHQIEGLYVDKNVSFADLKQTLLYFAKEMFGENTAIRLRPSYFPFTEPSGEMDVSCFICGGKGCNVCKYTGFLEVLGCGMVDPNVLGNCGIDSKEYTGFAFGMGIERIAMLKYQIKDIRLFFENDIRMLKQFEKAI